MKKITNLQDSFGIILAKPEGAKVNYKKEMKKIITVDSIKRFLKTSFSKNKAIRLINLEKEIVRLKEEYHGAQKKSESEFNKVVKKADKVLKARDETIKEKADIIKKLKENDSWLNKRRAEDVNQMIHLERKIDGKQVEIGVYRNYISDLEKTMEDYRKNSNELATTNNVYSNKIAEHVDRIQRLELLLKKQK